MGVKMGDEGGREGGLFSANPPCTNETTQKREGEAYTKTLRHHLEGGTHRCFQYKFEQGQKKFMWEKTPPRNNPSFLGPGEKKKVSPTRTNVI